jgi:nitrile hydratase accessory protein
MPHDPAHDAKSPGPAAEGAGPAFSEPWQARAFALAILAARQGCFTWTEWTQALGRERQGSADAAYFASWLSALQSLLVEKGAIRQDQLGERRDAWEAAYRRTPHGVPVSLTVVDEGAP